MKRFISVAPYFLLLLGVMFLFAVLGYGLFSNEAAVKQPSLDGRLLPLEALYDANTMQPVRLKQPAIVHIYLSRCNACHSDQEILSAFKEESCMDFIGLKWQGDIGETEPKIKQLIGSAYHRLWEASLNHIFVQLGMTTAPVTLVVDASGEILAHHRGRLNAAVLRELLQGCR